MIGIVVVTHSNLAREFIRAAEMIVGPADRLQSVSIDRSVDIDVAQQQLSDRVADVGCDGDGVIILTDMFGGTPTNISAELLSKKVEIVTGVNLPMLLKCINARYAQTVGELAAMLKEYGQKAVVRPSEIL